MKNTGIYLERGQYQPSDWDSVITMPRFDNAWDKNK